MVAVKNISTKVIDLRKDFLNKKDDMGKCSKYDKGDLLDLLPTEQNNVSFELHDAYPGLANGIRRCLEAEMSTFAFDYDEYDVSHDISDPFILSDLLKKEINLLRIRQDFGINKKLKNYENFKIYLHVTNETDEIIEISTNDLRIFDGETEIKDVVGKNIMIISLRPGHHCKLNNIKITSGTGQVDNGMFKCLENVQYAILDAQPARNPETLQIGKPHQIGGVCTRFKIAYTTYDDSIEPMSVMVNCCDTLINRLKIIEQEWVVVNKKTNNVSTTIDLKIIGKSVSVIIRGESWTLANLIAYNCYEVTDHNISFVTAAIEHPEKDSCVIRMVHPEFAEVMFGSIKKSIEDLEKIKKVFK